MSIQMPEGFVGAVEGVGSGTGWGKPAKEFTPAERGANKFSFLCRKVFWDTVEEMIRRCQMADVAIDNVYWAYGWNQSGTKILNRMKDNRHKGVKRV